MTQYTLLCTVTEPFRIEVSTNFSNAYQFRNFCWQNTDVCRETCKQNERRRKVPNYFTYNKKAHTYSFPPIKTTLSSMSRLLSGGQRFEMILSSSFTQYLSLFLFHSNNDFEIIYLFLLNYAIRSPIFHI